MCRRETLVSPDVVLVCEHDNHPGVGVLQQTFDDFVELAGFGLPRDLHRREDAHTPWGRERKQRESEPVQQGGGRAGTSDHTHVQASILTTAQKRQACSHSQLQSF